MRYADNVAGMARFGINPANTLGVSIPSLRRLAREAGRDHALALLLWRSGVHEARILAAFVDDPARVTSAQMERRALDFDSWDVCDQVCGNLFDRTPFAYEKAMAWAGRDEEFVRPRCIGADGGAVRARQVGLGRGVRAVLPADCGGRDRRAELREEGGELGAAADREAERGAADGGHRRRGAGAAARLAGRALGGERRAARAAGAAGGDLNCFIFCEGAFVSGASI